MNLRLPSLFAGLLIGALSASVVVGCATEGEGQRDTHERLYLAMELRSHGSVVGKPKLLGETGKVIRAEKKPADSDVPDYRLTVMPKADGDHYALKLDVQVPNEGADAHGELAMLHGEVKKLELGSHPGDLEVELLLMRVDSPEFRALMGMSERPLKSPNAI